MALGSSNQPAVEVSTRLDNSEIIKEMKELQREMKQSFKQTLDDAKPIFDRIKDEIKNAFKKGFDIGVIVSEVIGLIKSAVSSVIEFGKESILAAAEVEAAELKLKRLLELRGTAAHETLEELKALNSEVERGTGIDGDALIAVQAELSALGVLNKDLKAVTIAVIGFSEKYGIELPAAAEKVGRALVENRGGLEKFGIHAKDNTELVRELSKGYALAGDRLDTLSGKLDATSVAWGNLQEAVGAAMRQTGLVDGVLGSVKDGIESTTSAIERLTDWFGRLDSKTLEVYETFKSKLTRGLLSSIPGVGSVLAIKDAFDAATDDGVETEELDPRPDIIAAQRKKIISESNGVILATTNKKDEEEATKARKAALKLLEQQDHQDLLEMIGLSNRRGAIVEARRERETKKQADFDRSVMQAGHARIEQMIDQAHEEARVEDTLEKAKHEARKAADKREKDLRDQQLNTSRQYWGALTGLSAQGVASIITSMVAGAAAGERIDFRRLFGGLLTSIGQAAIQMGTVAVLAGTLGSVAPWLAPATGGPVGIAAGAALIAGGLAAVAAGSALGGRGASGASGGASGTAPRLGGTAPFAPSSVAASSPSGFADTQAGPRAMTVNVSLGRGMLFGTPRQLAREIDLVMRAGSTLRVGRG